MLVLQSKEESKDQEPSTTHDPGHHMGKSQKHKKHHIEGTIYL